MFIFDLNRRPTRNLQQNDHVKAFRVHLRSLSLYRLDSMYKKRHRRGITEYIAFTLGSWHSSTTIFLVEKDFVIFEELLCAHGLCYNYDSSINRSFHTTFTILIINRV
jgi:hypothetical protein